MQSPVKDARRPDLRLPEFDMPNIDLRDVKLPKVDLSEIEMPRIDVGKAVLGAATAAGIVRQRRARWPYLVAAGVAVAVAGWAVMNMDAIRTRLSRASTWAGEQVRTMQSGGRDDYDEPVAFTAAVPAPIAHPADISSSSSATTDHPDYPEGLGASSESLSTSESRSGNGRSTAQSRS